MSLKIRINDDMKSAMKAREAARLGAIRLLMAAMKQKEVDERIELDDAGIIAVIEKMIKQRKDSVSQYQAANRDDLADAEKFEIEVLSAYMPQALSHDEIALIVGTAIAEAGARSPAEMGKVVALVKPKIAGRADMAEVSRLIRARLSGA